MEDTSGNMAQDFKITSRRHTPKESESWTLLLIGELGKIASFRLNKSLVATFTAGLATILAFVVFATVSYYTMRVENRTLKDDLNVLEANLVAANKAKESALVRLMILEDRMKPDKKKTGSASGQKLLARTSQAVKPPAPTGEDTKDALSKGVKPVTEASPAQPAEASEAAKPPSPESISVQNLEIWLDAESSAVKFQFGLKNTDPQGNRVRGYTFLVLKPEEGSQEPLRASPWSPLKDGKPTLSKRGQYFSILRFKFVKGTLPGIETIKRFKTATVYVYSETGSLLAEQVFEVDKILRS